MTLIVHKNELRLPTLVALSIAREYKKKGIEFKLLRHPKPQWIKSQQPYPGWG